MTKKNMTGIFLLVILGLFLRLSWVISVENVQLSDFKDYHRLGKALSQGKGYTNTKGQLSAFRPPGLPFLLCGVYRLCGPDPFYGKIVMLAFSMLIPLLIYVLAGRIFNNGVAILAFAIAAFFPDFIFSTSILNSELPFTFFVTLGVLILSVNDGQHLKTPVASFAGLMFGIAALFRPIALVAPAAFFLALVVERKRLETLFGLLCAFTLAMAVPLGPWTYRNYEVFKEFVPVSTNSGYNLLCGNNPKGTVVWLTESELWNMISDTDRKARHRLNEVQRDRVFKNRALDYIKQYPAGLVMRMPRKLYLTFLSTDVPWLHWNIDGLKTGHLKEGPLFSILAASSRLFWYLIFLLSLFGATALHRLKENTAVSFSACLLILWTLIPIVYWGKARFRFPLYPFLIVMAASSCYYLTVGRKKAF